MFNEDQANGFIFGMLFAFTIGFILVSARRSRPAGKRRPSAIFTGVEFSDLRLKIKGSIQMIELKEGQKTALVVGLKTRHGHAAGIEPGSARFISTDESIVSVEQDAEDELKAIVRGLDGSSNGTATIEFRADGIRGEGEKEIVGVVTVVVTQGDASVVELVPGPVEDDEDAAEPQPEPAPAETATSGTDTAAGTVDGGSTKGEDEVIPGDEGQVHAGDPGTATGPPIEADNPNEGTTHPTPEGVEAGQPANVDPGADPKNVDPADRIAAGGPGSVEDPAEGQPTIDGGTDAGGGPSNDVSGPGSPSGSF
jgi:hypothetical protein